ncbi:hypothetical protein MLD38_020121 [Melastoma candidum]|uniref:Uncharacterized protein n=1 Tax=Melastoma candidum TaxID=119954 RepID=A0ACB9QDT7_9MYRT|nr:hypothetical protein MLD38_020121 [Melastoma candidum]
MNGGPSGFNNAPVTRGFIVASAVFSVFFGIRRSNQFGLSYQDIIQNLQISRLVPSIFAFSSSPELIFGLYLLYYFRIFERQIGSNKYSVFILFSSIASLLLEVSAIALLRGSPSDFLAPGPYGLIYASFIPFYFDIPVSTHFRVFGIKFSDKFFVYLAGLQLLLSSWRRSFLPGICGIVAGFLYRMNVFGIRKAKFPASVSSFFSRLSWLSSASPPASSRNVIPNVPSTTVRQRNFDSVPTTVEPSEEYITTLVSMGFDRDSARRALIQARNDINAATNVLLEAQSH